MGLLLHDSLYMRKLPFCVCDFGLVKGEGRVDKEHPLPPPLGEALVLSILSHYTNALTGAVITYYDYVYIQHGSRPWRGAIQVNIAFHVAALHALPGGD